MIKNRRIQNLLIGVIAASMGLTMYVYLISLQNRASSQNENVEVYVATESIPAGSTFNSIMATSSISKKSLPKSAVIGPVIDSSSKIEQQEVLRMPVEAGQLMLRNMFTPSQDFASGLQIPKGLLAVSIDVDDVSRVANFVVPGSKVVVFSTSTRGSNSEIVTRVLIPNALVLAVGSQVSQPPLGSQVTASPMVTLALNPVDAARVIQSGQIGKLSLALAYMNQPESIGSIASSSIKASSGGNN